jgi:hypothetical protein
MEESVIRTCAYLCEDISDVGNESLIAGKAVDEVVLRGFGMKSFAQEHDIVLFEEAHYVIDRMAVLRLQESDVRRYCFFVLAGILPVER